MNEPTVPKESALVEQSTTEIVPETQSKPEEMKQETEELMSAINRMVQAELQAAGDFTEEAYINAVRNAKQTIEQFRLIDKDQLENSISQFETDAKQNLEGMVKEIADFGDRISKAAQAAWDILTAPKES
ncbi:MAG: hypothetical protein WBA77_18070 [Microcoleaceae cyanobacterium]